MEIKQNIYKSEREAILDVLAQFEIEASAELTPKQFQELIADEIILSRKRVNPLTPEDRRKIIAMYHS